MLAQLLTLSILATIVSTDQRGCSNYFPSCAMLFDGQNCQGNSYSLFSNMSDLRLVNFGRRTSSVVVAGGCTLQLCTGVGAKGFCKHYHGSVHEHMREMNDLAMSASCHCSPLPTITAPIEPEESSQPSNSSQPSKTSEAQRIHDISIVAIPIGIALLLGFLYYSCSRACAPRTPASLPSYTPLPLPYTTNPNYHTWNSPFYGGPQPSSDRGSLNSSLFRRDALPPDPIYDCPVY